MDQEHVFHSRSIVQARHECRQKGNHHCDCPVIVDILALILGLVSVGSFIGSLSLPEPEEQSTGHLCFTANLFRPPHTPHEMPPETLNCIVQAISNGVHW